MSDEVSDFLRSVELLKGRREEEDEARSRDLEEKILQEKRERQARRAERARSISPQKSSPANTPSPSAQRTTRATAVTSDTTLPSPGLESSGSPRARAPRSSDAMESAPDYSHSSSKENDSPFDSDSKRTSSTSSTGGPPPSRTPLSWQRRPTSQASDRPKSRPLSVVAAENAAARSSPNPPEPTTPTPTPALAPADDQSLTRDQIAQSLAGKDPTWFRQTADRGQNSPAYRRNQVEDLDVVVMSSSRVQLAGMSRGSPSVEPTKDAAASLHESPALYSKAGSPLNLTNTPRLNPPTGGDASEGDEAPSVERQPTGRISPNRPISPTKGMGGFVQSAMMKRSDSVKRWSVTSPGGLQRADSSVTRSGAESSQRSNPSKHNSRPGSMLRDGSTTPSSRPTSSHEREPEQDPVKAYPTTPAIETPPAEVQDEADEALPTSPSKTMDPRRWSPTKSSSWLEAALNKPDSPKPKQSSPAVNQPAWMVELNKAKAQKANTGSGSAEPLRSPSIPRKPEIKTTGLLKSTPMGAATVKSAGLGGFPRISPSDKVAPGGFRGTLTPSSRRGSEDPDSGSPGAGTESTLGAKTKPTTPPKKDFRAILKPRAPPLESSTGQPDEFKDVFGKLRRAKTQNYVAPDELRSNILRGKAALNETGGPKKNERKDEFKEAILKKKDEFKKTQQEGRGVPKGPGSSSSIEEKPIPEGLAKRLEISRTGTISKQSLITPGSASPSETPRTLSEFARPSHLTASQARELANSPTSSLSSRLSSESEKEPVFKLRAPPVVQKETGIASRLQTKPSSGGGLADRFNPALAGLLARGQSPAGPTKTSSPPASVGSGAANTEEPAGPGPQLAHLTKNRARGPRRKAPTSAPKSAQNLTESEKPREPVKPVEPAKVEATSPQQKKHRVTSPKPEKFTSPKPGKFVTSPRPERPITTPKPEIISLVDSRRSMVQEKPQVVGSVVPLIDPSKRKSEDETKSTGQPITLVDSSSFKTRPRSPTKVHEQVAALAAKTQHTSKPVEDDQPLSQPSSPRKLDLKRMSRFLDEQGQPTRTPEPEKSHPPSPVKAQTFPDLASTPRRQLFSDKSESGPPVPAKNNAGPFGDMGPPVPAKSNPALLGGVSLGLSHATARIEPAVDSELDQRARVPPRGARPLPPPPKTSRTPPRVESPTRSPTRSPVRSPTRSPTKSGVEVTNMLSEFFGPDRPKRRYTADAAEILMKRPATGSRVQTQRAQLFRVFGDGKKIPVPAHYERVLFEREMYLCPHSFTDGAGKKVNEVYFWAGDEVPLSTVEDTEIFARREARSFGGKLVRLSQGKETAEFLQALGGIVIVRRGSSNKYDSLASNMLCGRRYLRQVAFDEVEFSPASLCSGFPYLITQQGKCYLWKGKGSDVDELGCARLVGMDLALMGELLEIEEDNEPESFWDIFGGGARAPSADHWRLKPNYDRYCGRLFCSNSADTHQITELFPFKQTDLVPSNIYILDAFFEMYIIVGARSQHQYAAFHNALDFAQEYAILAAGMEDRPFVPISTVVLEGIPRDLKSVFRKWQDSHSPTVMNPPSYQQPATSLRRGRSLRIVPLNQALQAVQADKG
ncbi:hypothetical protein B0H63DRAFT_488084 [Podospora didyma]|uniref:DUF4045 domain-containing protein n=1 Tax=Podospora didyma TaxID=330526 RepID=A0AAE0N2F4_9PEZI|nr:hypothetical protein B0H63DRAFT_488084 [Podospora didyma]